MRKLLPYAFVGTAKSEYYLRDEAGWLPNGSRMPEAYQNWQKIALAANGLLEAYKQRSVVFLGAIAPALSLEPLQETLTGYGWRQQPLEAINVNLKLNDPSAIALTNQNGTLILTQDDYTLCLLKADCCIAMAGTATEQFVGLGKPAIALSAQGNITLGNLDARGVFLPN